MDKLLLNLTGKSERGAQFRTVIALLIGEETQLFEGIVRGTIIDDGYLLASAGFQLYKFKDGKVAESMVEGVIFKPSLPIGISLVINLCVFVSFLKFTRFMSDIKNTPLS